LPKSIWRKTNRIINRSKTKHKASELRFECIKIGILKRVKGMKIIAFAIHGSGDIDVVACRTTAST
jgi:hypothetical protein